MDQNPLTLDAALSMVKNAVHNQCVLLGSKKSEVWCVHFFDDDDDVADQQAVHRLAQTSTDDEVAQLKKDMQETCSDVNEAKDKLSQILRNI